jgi:hypothetical protein
MRQLQIEVVNVSVPAFTKTARGGYTAIEVAYKGPDGKIAGKKLLDFANPTVYNHFLTVTPGEKYVVDTEKNEKGFYDWINVQPAGEAGAATAETPAPEKASSSGRGRVTGNNYETPEERATNRAAIMRQSTINMAIATLADEERTSENIKSVAKDLEDYIKTDLEALAEFLKTTASHLKGE